jgi:hypothetical protein
MTAQFPTTCVYQGKGFVIGAQEHPLFEPGAYGLFPIPSCSACWSGYLGHYSIREDALFLDNLEINLTSGSRGEVSPPMPPEINGRIPEDGRQATGQLGVFSHVYSQLDLPIPYTGKLTLCDDFIREYYVHMGWQSVWAFKNVIELTLENGKVVRAEDKSGEAADTRSKTPPGRQP